MRIRFPEDMKEFRCVGGACPDTCCKGWEIGIDRETLARYRGAKGELRERLKGRVDFRRGVLVFSGGVCPFLDGERLCSLQRQYGAGMLCRACRRYPRHVEEYGDRREYSLSLSCPAAVERLFGQNGPIRFAEREVPGEGRPEEVEQPLLEVLLRIRETALAIAGEERLPLELRMGLTLMFLKDAQKRLGRPGRREGLAKIPALGDRFLACCETEPEPVIRARFSRFERTEKERETLLCRYLDALGELAPSEERWPKLLDELYRFSGRPERASASWSGDYSRLFAAYLDLYLPGAVYDGRLLVKGKLAAFHCLALRTMEAALQRPLVSFAHIYGREIEHCAGNLDWLEDLLSREENGGVEAMLALILPPSGK